MILRKEFCYSNEKFSGFMNYISLFSSGGVEKCL